jgi:ribosomal protein S18 acetylase RimI-like enzyme
MADHSAPGSGRPVIVVRVAAGDSRYARARELRYDVLYRPLDLSPSLVEDTDGRAFEHFVALGTDGRVVGYARLHLEDGESQVYQVAVAQDMRGQGIGTALMDATADRARAAGRDFVVLDAREPAILFYERLGFRCEGDTFLSARTGTPHRRMRRALGT